MQKEKKRMNISDLHRETGLSRTLLTLMHKDELSRIDLESLNTLCNYFDCEVGDIILFQKDQA